MLFFSLKRLRLEMYQKSALLVEDVEGIIDYIVARGGRIAVAIRISIHEGYLYPRLAGWSGRF